MLHRYATLKKIPWAVLLIACVMLQTCCFGLKAGQADNEKPALFSDRTADIINATPLRTSNLAVAGGLTGAGQLVGIADSGLDKGSVSNLLPDLQSQVGTMPKVAYLSSYSQRAVPDDPVGHGTHMAGIIAGSGKSSQGRYQGIAPGSSLYFQALLDNQGQVRLPATLFDLYTPAYMAGVKIHVNGWGNQGNLYQDTTRQIDAFQYQNPDFLPVFGAGNSGPGAGTLSTEANSKNALVVGSSQIPRPAFGMEARDATQVTESSSRGPAADGRIKPDLLAPGSSVISTCSSLTESNMPANSMYTRMGGTSMAAAAAGGALALVREYLQTERHLINPSAAFLKALLINGARSGAGPANSSRGFGILDLAGTILAVQDRQYEYVDDARILQDQVREYRFTLPDAGLGMKATLVWTDPPAETGAARTLINDLDLVVRDPSGKLYYGNDYYRTGTRDHLNNVEQVNIPIGEPGEYIITVSGSSVDPRYLTQYYALVYGSPLQHDTVSDSEAGTLVLGSGKKVAMDKISYIQKGAGTGQPASLEGGELYWGSDDSYLFMRTWETGGVQLVEAQASSMVMEVNPSAREGGYYLDPRWNHKAAPIVVNGEAITNTMDFPLGAHISAVINPLRQTLWSLKAAGSYVEGYISRVDASRDQIWLLRDDQAYTVYPWTAIGSVSKIIDGPPEALPYGYADSLELESLIAGMRVKLLVTPGSRMVNYINLERQLVMGTIQNLDVETGTIELNTGAVYLLFPGTPVLRDGQTTSFTQLKTGDTVVGLQLPGSQQLLQMSAYSSLIYGRVIYYNDSGHILYLFDSSNRIQECPLNQQTAVYQWGSLSDPVSLEPGDWVRVARDPQNGSALRVDVAVLKNVATKTVDYYDEYAQLFHMKDGTMYKWQASTLVSYGGYAVAPQDMLGGSTVKLTTLSGGSPEMPFLAAIEAVKPPGASSPPTLNVRARALNGALILEGITSADRLSLYRQDGSRSVIIPEESGNFSHLFTLLPGENTVRVVAIESALGTIAVLETAVNNFQVPTESAAFSDIASVPARETILDFARKGIVSGYDDGTFRPNQPITRMEMVLMIGNYLNLSGGDLSGESFADENAFPWWAIGALRTAREQGLIEGYQDGTFKPFQPVTRSEAAVIMDRAYRIAKSSEIPGTRPGKEYLAAVPLWAQDAVATSIQRRLLPEGWQLVFQPMMTVSRAEAVMMVTKL